MNKFEKKMIEQDVPVSVVCNKSGKEVSLVGDMNYVEQNMIHNFIVNFGYGSDFDMETWEFDLDELALLEIVKTFQIRPKGFAEDARYPEAVFQEWKSTGQLNWKAGWSDEDHDEYHLQKQKTEEKRQEIKNLMDTYKNCKK